ncbi:MAG TPA: universal stress protein [Burkholderiales bacterium]|jgi:nucleotide-binding universal stress UspA family protein
MYKILVPVDGSDNALRALQYAVGTAKDHKSPSIHLLTVHPEPVLQGSVTVYLDSDKLKEVYREQGAVRLKRAAALVEPSGVPCTQEMIFGDIAPTIAGRADELGCDVIVMGTRGLSALGSLVLGSIANKVVHLAQRPVTLVK